MTPERAELIEQVAKIIAGPPFTFSDGTLDEDWREELDKAEQIVNLVRRPRPGPAFVLSCARCGAPTWNQQSGTTANNELDVCPDCYATITAEVEQEAHE